MRYFCTYFDANYLSRGLALHESLSRHAGAFEIVVLCMDDTTESALRARNLPHVRALGLGELIAAHSTLAAARMDRSKIEFYFTCTPWLMRHLLPALPTGEMLTYLDADLYFFGTPEAVYEEIGPASIAITPHRFPTSLAHLERYGRYNVGWVSLRHDPTGLACAADWADQCASWCFNRLEDDRYADQKYLDAWDRKFPGVVSLRHPGVNVAPWNVLSSDITRTATGVAVNGASLIFYHFHSLLHLGRQLYDPGLHKYNAELSPTLRESVYLPYLQRLLALDNESIIDPDLVPAAQEDDPRHFLAVRHLLARLQASELDRAQRLSSIEENIAATQQTIGYLRIVEADRDQARADHEKTVAYLRSVEKDSSDRLASIHFYQDKLKASYADLERNVAYLKTLEAEIKAHIEVSAAKDGIIADLHAQLQRAAAPGA